jgi:hypothetical protein
MDAAQTVTAVAFTHLHIGSEEIFSDGTNLERWVENEWGEGLGRFARCRNIRLVYLFLSNAYQAHLLAVNRGAAARTRALRADRNENRIRGALRQYLLRLRARKFVIVGLQELIPLLEPMGELSINSANADLNTLFLGQGEQLFYDCPKVIEALIRIGRRSMDIHDPILRFDEDVFVEEDAVERLIAEYHLQRSASPYYFFSGNYQHHDPRQEIIDHLLNDFSVRVHFLSHHDGRDINWYLDKHGFPTDGSAFAQQARDVAAALKGEGTDPFTLDTELAWAFLNQIVPDFGPDIHNQPISGAGLCISPMAIVQLPPFANVATNIMWIDDALKLNLHLGIRDISTTQAWSLGSASFEQNRHPHGVHLSDVVWAYSSYLPRLIMGFLMFSLMFDPLTLERYEPFAESFADYMRTRRKPNEDDRVRWANTVKSRMQDLKEALCGHDAAGRTCWKPFADAASYELTLTPAQEDLIQEVIRNPDLNVSELCRTRGLPVGRNAGAHVAEVIADLHRYIELVDLWPYIVRTIDYLFRSAPWLQDPDPL